MMTSVQIHPTAIVESGAELDSGVNVGAYAVIGKNVKIGKGTNVHHHAYITGYTTIGQYNEIFSFAAVGNPPQDLKYKGEPTTLTIGDRNTIREFATLQPGTVQDQGKTIVGNENLLMSYTHVAHDCVLGNQNILSNCAQLAGHVVLHDMVVLGGFVGVHQFVQIGDLAMLAAGSMVGHDVPPYCIVEGNRATLKGLNSIGMKRKGLSAEMRTALKEIYKIFFLKNHATLEAAFAEAESYMSFSEAAKFVEFIKKSKRGIIRPEGEKNQTTEFV